LKTQKTIDRIECGIGFQTGVFFSRQVVFPVCLAPIRTTNCLADELDRFESHYGAFSDRRKRNENTGKKALADINIVDNMLIRPVLSRKRYMPFLNLTVLLKVKKLRV